MSHLRLVSSFSNEKYPYRVNIDTHEANKICGQAFFSPIDSAPYDASMMKLKRVILMAGIKDHVILRDGHIINAHFKTEEDWRNIILGLSHKEATLYTFEYDLTQIPRRQLRKRLNHAANVLDKEGLAGRFRLVANYVEGQLEIYTTDKPAYFHTRRLRPEEHILGIDIL